MQRNAQSLTCRQKLRSIVILYLLLLTPVPPSCMLLKEASIRSCAHTKQRTSLALMCTARCYDFRDTGASAREWLLACTSRSLAVSYTNRRPGKGFVNDTKKSYLFWRRGRKLKFPDNDTLRAWVANQIACKIWSQALFVFSEAKTYCSELAHGLQLFLCVLIFPVMVTLMLYRASVSMIQSKIEFLRCFGEVTLLLAMWQGRKTTCIAMCGYALWILDLHLHRKTTCRGFTWLVVCLAQRHWSFSKLVFLTMLACLTPLYGKRSANATKSDTAHIKSTKMLKTSSFSTACIAESL